MMIEIYSWKRMPNRQKVLKLEGFTDKVQVTKSTEEKWKLSFTLPYKSVNIGKIKLVNKKGAVIGLKSFPKKNPLVVEFGEQQEIEIRRVYSDQTF